MEKKLFTNILILLFCVQFQNVFAQETLPIYQDYLSDNIYLIHPAAAGVGECGKIRVTARNQWLNIEDAPQLQTISFHAKVNPNNSKSAYGLVLFNDKNGYHSQKGVQATYAYHLPIDLINENSQLSFGLSFSLVQNQSDQTSFIIPDPEVAKIIESDLYFNSDFGIAYHVGGLATYFTVKNLFLSSKNYLKSEFDAVDLRNYVLGFSYFFSNPGKIELEPSVLFQVKEHTGEKWIDLNLKVYKEIEQSRLWGGISYRSSLDNNALESASYISPIIGIDFNRFMVSYTYTHQINSITFAKGGFHQFSLGYNLLCGYKRTSASCPNLNGFLF